MPRIAPAAHKWTPATSQLTGDIHTNALWNHQQLPNVTIRAPQATGSTLQDGKEAWCNLTAKEHLSLPLLAFPLQRLEDTWCFQGLLTTKAIWYRVVLSFSRNISSSPVLMVVSVVHLGVFWQKVFWGQWFIHLFY